MAGMNVPLTPISQDDGSPLAELCQVKSLDLIKEGGREMPKGAIGTVVQVYDHGAAYEVEFTSPLHAVIFARREQLTRI